MSKFKFNLNKTVQCAKCPWKVTVNPRDIPNDYCEIKHKGLKNTIAEGDFEKQCSVPFRAMACHDSQNNNMFFCIGWLHNQMGTGNNIRLRLMMRDCSNVDQIKVVGEQHPTFEDTLPKD